MSTPTNSLGLLNLPGILDFTRVPADTECPCGAVANTDYVLIDIITDAAHNPVAVHGWRGDYVVCDACREYICARPSLGSLIIRVRETPEVAPVPEIREDLGTWPAAFVV